MTKTRPPKVPEQPVAVLTDDQLGALLNACTGKAFTARRDLPDDAPLRRRAGGPIYPNLVQSSGSELAAAHGAYLVDILASWAKAPSPRALTAKQIAHAPRQHKQDSSLGPVSIPDDDASGEPPTAVIGATRPRPQTQLQPPSPTRSSPTTACCRPSRSSSDASSD